MTALSSSPALRTRISLPDEAATEALAGRLVSHIGPGDVLLLAGPIGSGKTTFARALIRAATDNPAEEVPSPTFTLVQTYATPLGEVWHADLYRLEDPHEALELGLDEAMDHAICLIEWPEHLGDLVPTTALTLAFEAGTDGHEVVLSGDTTWRRRLGVLFV